MQTVDTTTPYAIGKDWTLYAGECAAVMRAALADESIDLTVTSPPYDPVYLIDGRLVTDCKNGQRDYQGYEWDFVEVATELWRVTKQGGVVVWIVGDKTIGGSRTGTPFRQLLKFIDIGFNLHQRLFYEGSGPPPDPTRYDETIEEMFVFSKGRPKTINLIQDKVNRWAGQKGFGQHKIREADGSLGNRPRKTTKKFGKRTVVWRYASGYGYTTKDEANHPAMFPEALAHDHIISWSNPGNTVLDCFAGSLTTPKMAILTGRKAIGIDISADYLADNIHRLHAARLPLFEQPGVEVTAEQLGLELVP